MKLVQLSLASILALAATAVRAEGELDSAAQGKKATSALLVRTDKDGKVEVFTTNTEGLDPKDAKTLQKNIDAATKDANKVTELQASKELDSVKSEDSCHRYPRYYYYPSYGYYYPYYYANYYQPYYYGGYSYYWYSYYGRRCW